MIQKFLKLSKFLFFFSVTSLFAEKTENIDSLRIFDVPSVTVSSDRMKMLETPVPFSQVNQEKIKQIYTVQDLPSIMSELPSSTFYSQNGNAIGYSMLTLRGIDERRISVMINGVPQNDPEDHIVYWIDFPDITSNLDNIQVQRGAGLTGYGPAAIAGTVNLTTTNFVNQRGIRVFSGIGWQEYGANGSQVFQPITNKLSFEASSGLVDNYAFYGRVSQINSLGYRDRSYTNLNSFFISAARFDDNVSTQINIFGGPFSDGLAYNGVPKSYIGDAKLRRLNPAYGGWSYDSTGKNLSYFIERRPQETEEFSQPHFELLNDWSVSKNVEIKSILFYYQGEGSFNMDGSWNDAAGYRMTRQYGFDSVVNPTNSLYKAYVGNRQWGWLPRVVWQNAFGEFTGGLELRIHRSEHWGQLIYAEALPPGYNPDYKFYFNRGERNIISGFARENFRFNDQLSIYAEGQLVHHSYSISDEKAGNLYTQYLTTDGNSVGKGGKIFTVDYLFFNPRIGLNYLIAKDMNLFGLVAYTSREPRMRNFYAADDAFFGATPLFEADTAGGTVRYNFSKPIIKPEKMLNAELGWNLLEEDYKLSANLYLMQYNDELVKSGKLDINGNPVDGNAPRTVHYGLELDGSANVIKTQYGNLRLSGNMTLSVNKIQEYNYISSSHQVISLKDNDIAGFPSFLANLRLTYQMNEFYCSILMKYIGTSRTDNFGDLLQTDEKLINSLKQDFDGYYYDNRLDAYTVYNLDMSYNLKNILSAKNLKIHFQVLNLMNKLYAGGAEGKEFFPAAERSVFIGLELGL